LILFRRTFLHPLKTFVATFVFLIVFVQLPMVKTNTFQMILNLSLPAGLYCEINHVHGYFPIDLTIPHIEIKDNVGTFIDIKNIIWKWKAIKLFKGKISIPLIKADSVIVHRPPATETNIMELIQNIFKMMNLPLKIKKLYVKDFKLLDNKSTPLDAHLNFSKNIKIFNLDLLPIKLRADYKDKKFTIDFNKNPITIKMVGSMDDWSGYYKVGNKKLVTIKGDNENFSFKESGTNKHYQFRGFGKWRSPWSFEINGKPFDAKKKPPFKIKGNFLSPLALIRQEPWRIDPMIINVEGWTDSKGIESSLLYDWKKWTFTMNAPYNATVHFSLDPLSIDYEGEWGTLEWNDNKKRADFNIDDLSKYFKGIEGNIHIHGPDPWEFHGTLFDATFNGNMNQINFNRDGHEINMTMNYNENSIVSKIDGDLIKAQVDYNFDTRIANISNANVPLIQGKLLKPVQFSLYPFAMIDDVKASIGTGSFMMDKQLAWQLNHVNVNSFIPVKGSIDGKGNFKDKKATIHLKDFGKKSIKTNINLTMDWNDKVQIDCVGSDAKQNIVLKSKIQSDSWGSDINGFIHNAIDLKLLTNFSPKDDRIKGKLETDLNLSGTLFKPLFNGKIEIFNGRYQDFDLGLSLKKIQGACIVKDNIMHIPGINISDDSPGSAILSGDVYPNLNLRLDIKNMTPIKDDDMTLGLDGFVKIYSHDTMYPIEGEINIPQLIINLPDSDTEENEGVVVKNMPHADVPKLKKIDSTESSIIPLKININKIQNAHIKGRNLNSYWYGNDCKIMGDIQNPILYGALSIRKGVLELLNKKVPLTEGLITYSGEKENIPMLKLIASKSVEGIQLAIKIEGKGIHPTIEFVSSPMLPQEEIVSLLLFEQHISNISVSQGISIANAVISLQEGGKDLNFIDQIQSSFGLDNIEIKSQGAASDGTNSQVVSLGKQLTDKVYVSINQGVDNGSGTSAALQYKVSGNFNVQAQMGTQYSTGLGMNYSKRW
jgi:hypothetical protein